MDGTYRGLVTLTFPLSPPEDVINQALAGTGEAFSFFSTRALERVLFSNFFQMKSVIFPAIR
jgi:hypothetical protein